MSEEKGWNIAVEGAAIDAMPKEQRYASRVKIPLSL